jgi:error-prone DNA polymerase
MSGFVHLHCHSTWSLLDGAIPADVLPFAAAELGYEAVALTDHDSLLGAVRFTKACRAAGVKPIFGAELTLEGDEHVTVIARDATGYGNLCRLITSAHLGHERGDPMTSFDALVERAEGLFVLSGCERGAVARLAAAGQIPRAIETAKRWRRAVGDGYRVEVFDHRGYGHRALRDRLLAVAREADVRPVATNDVHYLDDSFSVTGARRNGGAGYKSSRTGAVTHELLHAIKDIVPLSKTQALRSNAEYSLKPPAEMRALFHDVPEALDETLRIADACEFDLELGRYHFPHIPIPDGESAARLLRQRCYEGASRRFDRITKEVEDRLEHELEMIFAGSRHWGSDRDATPNEDGFASYFLLVSDIVDHTKNVLGIRCACRGSAAGSLVCYVLGISDVDPVRYDLLFERFMNARREELPDIDVDVESHRREEVLEHILSTYGTEQTAMCCMVDTFRARMAIREVGKAIGLPPEEIDLVAKAFPRIRAKDIPKAIEHLPELQGANISGGQLEHLFELCFAIDGFPRHLALHPSGVILSSSDLADRVPMQESYGGFTMLQADKHDVEDLGLVKLDVLGVRMLSSMAHACDEVARIRGAGPDLAGLGMDDPVAYQLMRTSRTLGCFQIESPGQRDLLARLQPQGFEDLIVEISLFRPGPVNSDMVSPYLQRRHGYEQFRYQHERLEPILKETNGIIVYHEQVIRVIAAVTGCELADADHVRRHLDSERPSLPDDPNSRPARKGLDGPRSGVDEDNEVGRWFIAAGMQNGFTRRQAEELWHEVYAFASFGFCKAHAAAFALPTYLSSWLKAHYPAEFYAGLLTHDPGMYPRRLIVADARQFGIPILPIDVNRSDTVYRAELVEDADVSPRCGVRLAFSEVRDISEAEMDSIISARASGGPFASLEDLWRRAELSRPVLEHLVHIGSLDQVEPKRSRRELLWRALDLASRSERPKARRGRYPRRAAALKEGLDQLTFSLDEPIDVALPGLSDYTPLEETEAELAVSGIDARRHVMELYQPLMAEIGCISATDLQSHRNDSQVWVAGVKVASQTPAIRSGQRIIFITLDDMTGPIDVTVFERAQPRCARTVFHSWLLLIRGALRKRGGASLRHRTDPRNVGVTIVVDEAFDLAEIDRDRKTGHSVAASLGRQRKKQTAALGGARGAAPGVDLGANLAETRAPSGRMWHSSGGSAGR